MKPEEIVDKCAETGQRLVLDTEHLVRDYRDYEIAAKPERAGKLSLLGDSRHAATILSPWISGIHFKPIEKSTEDFFVFLHFNLAQEEKILCDLVLEHVTTDIILVAEYPPTKGMLLSPAKSHDIAARMLEAMHRLTER